MVWRFLLSFVCAATVFAQSANAIPLIRDAEIEHTLRVYGDPIFKAAGLNPANVKLFIVNDDSLNAYVAGGSNMFLHTGIIMASDTPDMLIGVMAHETGHIAGGHLARGAEKLKNAQLGTIFSVVLGAAAAAATHKPEAAAAVIGGSSNSVMRGFLAHTRTQEESADQAALGFLDKLGISASGMLKTFALLQRNERQHVGARDPYLLTHPLNTDRIEFVRNHVENSKIPEGQYPKSLDILHKRMVAKLFGFMESPERTLQQYPPSDKSVPARMARAIAYYKMPDIDRAITEMDSLISESKSDPFFHELKGQILFENNRQAEALASYEQAAKLLPTSPLILSDLAKVELAQKEPKTHEAITHLEMANSLDATNEFSWRLLATAYGKTGNFGMSYLALAEEAILEDKPDSALKQVEQALTILKEGSPGHQRAQDVKLRAIEMQRTKKEAESPF
jgi:predicted Zn-dependent protease